MIIKTPDQYNATLKWTASLQKVRDQLDNDQAMGKKMREYFAQELDSVLSVGVNLLSLYWKQKIERDGQGSTTQ